MRTRVIWFALAGMAIAAPRVAQAQAPPPPSPAPPPAVCVPAPPFDPAVDYQFDAAAQTVAGKVKHRKSARPRLIIVNKNPFLYEYKVTVAETAVPEPDLGAFIKLLGGPAVDLLPAPEAKATTPAASGAALTGCETTAIVAQENRVRAARDKADSELATRKPAYDALAATVKHAEAVFKTNAVCAYLYPLATQLKASLDAYDPKLEELEESIAAFSLAVREQDRLLDAYGKRCPEDNIKPNREIQAGQQAALDKLKVTLKKLTEEKARFAALAEKMEPILASPSSFTEVRQIGDYDVPTNVKITIERKERVEKATLQPMHTQTLRFGGGQRFVLGGGWTWSTLEKVQYAPKQGFPVDREGNRIQPEVLGPTLGFEEDSGSRHGPIAALHSRLWPEVEKWNHLWLTVAVTAKNDNKGTNPEYLIGPSVSFAEDRAFITVGVYGGQVQELQAQLYAGGPIPKELAEIPVKKNTHWKLGLGVSWKIK